MTEYITKVKNGWTNFELENELQELIKEYNELTDRYLFIYVAGMNKPHGNIPISLEQFDYYTIVDLLSNVDRRDIDILIETPGGSGETAEEIVKFLRNKFEHINFMITGEAKSAGTILALSGDEIYMTNTASMGPIDAQVPIGRSTCSAYDYIEWVKEKRAEAEEQEKLNNFDAIMIAQITPGELKKVHNSLKYAEDLVKDWLPKYKFKNWEKTETHGNHVTEKMKEERAQEIAEKLTENSEWRSHGRSLKIEDLENMGLRIHRVDENIELSKVIHKIHTVYRILFDSTNAVKIYATSDNKIFRNFVQPGQKPINPQTKNELPEVVNFSFNCSACNKTYNIYAKLRPCKDIDKDMEKKGCLPFPKNNIIKCVCGKTNDLSGAKKEIEQKTGRNIII